MEAARKYGGRVCFVLAVLAFAPTAFIYNV